MDASAAPPKANADINEVYGLLLTAIDNRFPKPMNQRSTIIKYTKLPDFEIESNISWPPQKILQPRVRRIVTLDDSEIKTTRSLNPEILSSMNVMGSKFTKRKIVTIAEDDENDLHPKFSREKRPNCKTSSRSIGSDFIVEEKQSSQRHTSRLTSALKYAKEIKASSKSNNANKKEVNLSKQNYRGNQASNPTIDNTKTRYVKDKEISRYPKASSISSKSSISKNLATPRESVKDVSYIKSKLSTNSKSNDIFKKPEKNKRTYSPSPTKNKILYLKELQSKSQPLTVIHVPLDDKYKNRTLAEAKISSQDLPMTVTDCNTVDRCTETEEIDNFKDVNIGTDPFPKTVDRITDTNDFEIDAICKCEVSTVQTQSTREPFDSLEIPNVTLTKEKTELKPDTSTPSKSLPNLKVPALKITPRKEEYGDTDVSFCHNGSYIISRATLTYTTRQKINFHVVGSNDSVSPEPLPSPLAYPVNVVSVYKKECSNDTNTINKTDDSDEKKKLTNYTNCFNEMKSLNCSYMFNSDKLMKPSDIISTIRVNNSLIQSDYICEQFQRELNFIDSFFESLQYLESCSLAGQCFTDDKVEKFVHDSALFDSEFDVKNSEYDNFLSKIENGASADDTETMASKSLCLLNLLIRDEQRRAKNLLFVLKMREDALKDFTKSQILWLEKKKKQDNTDIPTLKKKQRGALLKLQHECGEMQRMRKALLTLSEKRKVALMKTKKNIELKLNNNVEVEQIIFGKKKLKRSISSDRITTPLKCFDLSSSGCEDSTTSRANSEAPIAAPEPLASVACVSSVERSVQTGDSVVGSTLMDQSTNTAAENFVAVDGGYLNILFHNLMFPQIFSSGKQYEVNEEALKKIVNSANNHNNNVNGCDIVEKLMEQIKNRDLDRLSSSPSTARSLVDEFDQYYKDLANEDKTPPRSPERKSPEKVLEIKDIYAQVPELSIQSNECNQSNTTMTCDSTDNFSNTTSVNFEMTGGIEASVTVECECQTDKEIVTSSSQIQTGPLPVPVGAAAILDTPTPDANVWLPPKSSDSSSTCESVSSQALYATSITSLTVPAQHEAEELRRQQLAIEREIKALEQQQCQMLVVREIPDKPPPPYTPPAEPRASKPPRMFAPDDTTEERIEQLITNPENTIDDPTDPFNAFLNDFCAETLQRHKLDQSDKPWDACNLLPQKPLVDNQQLVEKTSTELKEILTGAVPSVVSGFSSRRSDHIDDILFSEWRRCEPEWTTLHTDEAIVKNQLFESIFQKILTETIDEYRRTVQCNAAE